MNELGDKGDTNRAELAATIVNLLGEFGKEEMIKSLSETHQILEMKKRESNSSSNTDDVTWELEALKTEIGQMEQLFKQRAYNKAEDRVSFIICYNNVVQANEKNPKRSD